MAREIADMKGQLEILQKRFDGQLQEMRDANKLLLLYIYIYIYTHMCITIVTH